MRIACWCAVALAWGCGSEETVRRERVQVIAHTHLTSPYGPDHGALVVFADRDGTSRIAYTEPDGRAEGDVEVGGSVWVGRHHNQGSQGSTFTAYTDVQGGEVLEYGPVPEAPPAAPRGTMTILGDPPGAWQVYLYSSCGPRSVTRTLELDARCGATVNILATAYELSGTGNRLMSYAYLPDRPIVQGSTITIDASAWRAPEMISIQFTNAERLLDTVSGSDRFSITNTFGIPIHVGLARVQNNMLTASVPLTGPDVLVSLTPARTLGQPGQAVLLRLPAVASQSVDLRRFLAPWVVREEDQWSADDLGGALEADALIVDHQWVQPVANFERNHQLRIISPPSTGGSFAVPALPDALSELQPGADFRVDTSVRLFRLDAEPPIEPLRAAQRAATVGGGCPSIAVHPFTACVLSGVP